MDSQQLSQEDNTVSEELLLSADRNTWKLVNRSVNKTGKWVIEKKSFNEVNTSSKVIQPENFFTSVQVFHFGDIVCNKCRSKPGHC